MEKDIMNWKKIILSVLNLVMFLAWYYCFGFERTLLIVLAFMLAELKS